ncbi:MAG TPA: hypothetical protein VGF40_00595, partial [Thermoanaerobaculia bacterium]
MVKRSMWILLTILAVAAPLAAQERAGAREGRDESDQRLTTELRLQGWRFDNFFQASDPALEQDIDALGAELRFARAGSTGWLPYFRANYLDYSEEVLDPSFGGRVGVRYAGRPHRFEIYLDHQIDRPTFDIGDVFDTADVTTAVADYGLRFADDWELGLQGEVQQQSFNELEIKNNDFMGAGASLRFRGFGSMFSPEVGYMSGEREVDDPTETYDQTETYVQIRSAPAETVYLSLRYRMRGRDYSTDDVTSSNFGREDDRDQWALTADWRMLPRLTWNLYWATEDAQSTRVEREF